MRSWFNWRTAIASIALGLLFASSLFLWTKQQFSLSGLDLFFAITTVISLAFNLWQLFRDQYKYEPLKNSLIGVFNDLKGRSLRAYQRQLLITSKAGMDSPLEAVRLEFYDYVQETMQTLEQVREHLVAAIHTIDPDASSQQVFRAAEFGLTEQERQARRESMDRYIENLGAAAPAAGAITGSPTADAKAEVRSVG